MTKHYFREIDFEALKKQFGIVSINLPEWVEQPNDILVRPLISKEESTRCNVTYVGLKFSKPTDGHLYRTQTDHILFRGYGMIEFSCEHAKQRKIYEFCDTDSISIPPHVIRKIIPRRNELEIELIVHPKFDPRDEIHVYD